MKTSKGLIWMLNHLQPPTDTPLQPDISKLLLKIGRINKPMKTKTIAQLTKENAKLRKELELTRFTLGGTRSALISSDQELQAMTENCAHLNCKVAAQAAIITRISQTAQLLSGIGIAISKHIQQ